MVRVAVVHRSALATHLESAAARLALPLEIAGELLRPAAREEEVGHVRAEVDWPSPLNYRLAEFSMMAYDDPAHHSAAADILAARNRSIVLAAFEGDATSGPQGEWCDRLIGFLQLGAFLHQDGRSFFAHTRVLAYMAQGDHFLSEIASLARDGDRIEQAIDALLAERLDGQRLDLYVADLVIPDRRALALLWKKALAIKQTQGVGALAAVLVPAKSFLADDHKLVRRMERRSRQLGMERIAVCPPLNEDEETVPQEFWLGREAGVRPYQRALVQAQLWLQRHRYAVPLAAGLLGALLGWLAAALR